MPLMKDPGDEPILCAAQPLGHMRMPAALPLADSPGDVSSPSK